MCLNHKVIEEEPHHHQDVIQDISYREMFASISAGVVILLIMLGLKLLASYLVGS